MSTTARRALLVGTERYDDSRFTALPSCRADAWAMEQVLRHPAIGSFDTVSTVHDPSAAELRQHIGEFLDECGPDDLALLYLSGHGMRLPFSSGEFFFITRDTDADRLQETAVSAGFVNEQLEACRAPQKVTIIDACESGGFALGLRTRDAKSAATEQQSAAPLQSRGVYVLSSSGAGEASYSGPVVDGRPTPSIFTGEIVQSLQDGTADHDGDGKVSVVDLFHHVSGRIRNQERSTRQAPVYSAVGVNSKIVIANVVAGGSIRLEAPPDTISSTRSTGLAGRKDAVPAPHTPTAQWQRLLDYYRRCLQVETREAPLLRLSEEGERFVYLPGRERLLSGGSNDDDHLPLDEATAAWTRRVSESGDELWAGYPAVLLYGSRDRAERDPRFAPLVVRRVEVADDGTGLRISPAGPAEPHPGLARECLGEEQAQHLAATYYASWHAGGYAQMTKDLRELLRTEYELPMVEELRPELLESSVNLRTPTTGARNVALLYRVSRRDGAVAKLLDDLADLRSRVSDVDKTAMAALLTQNPTSSDPIDSTGNVLPALPLMCNDSQRAVITASMTARLTTATGPPGTGKSQLVANAVATAVASGESVLVASTNNAAVDEVWRRCRDLLPGLLVRTGSRSGPINYAENETSELTELAGLERPRLNTVTARAALTRATRQVAQSRGRLAEVAELERELLELAQRRQHLAETLRCTAGDLAGRLGDGKRLIRWQQRARRCAGARLFHRRRQARLLRALLLSVEPTVASCRALSEFAAAEQSWATLRSRAATVPTDRVLADEADETETRAGGAALTLVDAVIRSNALAGRQRILDLLQAKQEPGSDWGAVKRALSRKSTGAPAAGGWAVSSLSARRFPPDPALFDLVIVDEASQCSIPQLLPLLFRARRALVIGDPMQLRHIAAISPQREAEARRDAGMSADWVEEHRLAYRRNSAFHTSERATGGSLLLDEHYRCHPQIADLVNRQFYGGQLTVLTDVRDQRRLDRDPIVWSPVEGRPARPSHGGSWINTDEVRKVNDCVRYVVQKLPDATIGVVTPYKAQAELIARSWRDEPRVRVGTVHTFQGGQRDVIVFGLVAGAEMPTGSVAWLESERNLWNVAISRARSHLIVVGNRGFWSTRRGIGAAVAAEPAEPVKESPDDPLRDRLYDLLSRAPGAAVELAATVHGHGVDALVHADGRSEAVLLDRGTPPTVDAAGHLRLQYRRMALLTSEDQPGGATRLPAWRLYDDEPRTGGE
ncbi:AAA domain-containing protein [Actinoplanes sp. NPDC051851]|uniref:caspase, EACC1-associated type n=1 Tax=Actinoplanes sp. NPDC051851 TaxID=3154753 RepID=UPI00342DB1A8